MGSIENLKNDSNPRCRNPPRLMFPQFFYWLSVDTKATSRILEKKPKTEVQQHTHGTTLTTATSAQTRTTVEPRKINNKLSFVGVRCSSCKQIQKKPQKKLARGT